MTTTTKTERRRLINAWIDEEDADLLDQVALAADRSRSAELRIAIREHLERTEKEESS